MLVRAFLLLLFLIAPCVVGVPFGDPFVDRYGVAITDEFTDFFRNSFRKPFTDPSLVDLLTRSVGGTGDTVNTTQYRLPQNLKPTKYDLTVVPFLVEGNFTFYGKVKIDVTAVQNATEIVLNSLSLTVTSATLTDSAANATTDCEYFNGENQRLIIKPLNASLVANKNYQIAIVYTGKLQDDMLGFYRSSYKVGSQVKWLAITQFSPTFARRAFPCFDEPAFRAVFTIHVGRFEHQNSISNMPVKSTSGQLAEFENRVLDTYEDSPPMPTYLVGFCVSELFSVTSSDGRFRAWAREDAIDQAKYIIGAGETILKTISDFVGVPFTLPKLDVVAVPDFYFGAMENWGMVTFKERRVLWEEGVSSAMDKESLMTTVAHEFGHQWFGNLVTPQWWSYTWLKEAFATYFQYYVPDVMEPQWGMQSLFMLDNIQRALQKDATAVRTPMTTEEYSPEDILMGFSYVPYQKGGSILRMTDHFLTRTVFQTGLNYYLTNSSGGGIGTPEHLFSYLDSAAKERNVLPSSLTVAKVLNTWTTQGGFPLLTVTRTGKTLSLSQKIFTTNASDTAADQYWFIPLSYTTQSVADFQDTSAKDWLSPGASKSVSTSDSGWVIFNIQQTGFYRVNYDTNNWELLTRQLLDNLTKIHANNRAQLLDDAFNLAEAGEVAYKLPFSLAGYLSQEREYVPWFSAMTNMKHLLQRLQGTTAGRSLQEYTVDLVRPYYQYIMGIKQSSESHQTALSRGDFIHWACDLGMTECETYAKNAFNDWLNNGVPIGANVKAAILCTGLKLGGDQDWDAVWNFYLQSNCYGEKLTILDALACTRSETSIQKYLSMLLSPLGDIRKQDEVNVVTFIASRPSGIPPTISYVVNNYNDLMQNHGLTTIAEILAMVGQYMVLDEHIDQVRAVINNNSQPFLLRTLLNVTTLPIAELNKEWAANHQDQVQLWFDQNRSSGSRLIQTHMNSLFCLTILFILYFFNDKLYCVTYI